MSEPTNTQDQPAEGFDVHELDAKLKLKDLKEKFSLEIEKGRNKSAPDDAPTRIVDFLTEAYESCLQHIEALENKGYKSTLISKAVVRYTGGELSKYAKGIHEFSRNQDLTGLGRGFTGHVAVRDEYVQRLNAWAHVLDQLDL